MTKHEIVKDILVAAIQKGVFDSVTPVDTHDGNMDLVEPKIQSIAAAFKTIYAAVDNKEPNITVLPFDQSSIPSQRKECSYSCTLSSFCPQT